MKSIDVPNLSKPIWPSALTRVAAQRDRARNVAIRLEQENHALLAAANALREDLIEMHRNGAIDLGAWPAAQALIDVIERSQS